MLPLRSLFCWFIGILLVPFHALMACPRDTLSASEGAPVFSILINSEDTLYTYVEYKSFHYDRFNQEKQNFITYSQDPKFSYLSRKSVGYSDVQYFKNGNDEYKRLFNERNSILAKLCVSTKFMKVFLYKRLVYTDLKIADSTNAGSKGAGMQQKNSVYYIFMKPGDTILWCKSGQCEWTDFMGSIPYGWEYSQVNSFSELAPVLFSDEKTLRELIYSNTKGYRWKDLNSIVEKYSKAKSSGGG